MQNIEVEIFKKEFDEKVTRLERTLIKVSKILDVYEYKEELEQIKNEIYNNPILFDEMISKDLQMDYERFIYEKQIKKLNNLIERVNNELIPFYKLYLLFSKINIQITKISAENIDEIIENTKILVNQLNTLNTVNCKSKISLIRKAYKTIYSVILYEEIFNRSDILSYINYLNIPDNKENIVRLLAIDLKNIEPFQNIKEDKLEYDYLNPNLIRKVSKNIVSINTSKNQIRKRNNRLKSKKRKAKLLALLTIMSLIGYASYKHISDKQEEMSVVQIETMEPTKTLNEGEHIEIIDKNGVIYPSKLDNFTQSEFYAFAKQPIAIYDSYKMDKEVIGCIPKYQCVNGIFSDGDLSYVVTENGQTGYVHNCMIEILPDNYIEVDLSDQKVKVVDDNEIVLYCDVVTGKPGTETDIGYTEVLSKTYNRPLIGPGYRLDVKYFIHFNNSEEGFHDNYRRNEFGGDIYLTNGSHGCVNMNLEDVIVMDEHTEVGTKVLVHD